MDTSTLIEKVRKPALITTGLISAYALVGFVILPKVLESQIPKMIESKTGRKAALEKLDFNPFSLELSLQGFSMQEKDLQTFISFDEFFVNVQFWSSLKNLALVIDKVSLSQPYVRLEMLPDDQYNFSDLLSDSEEEVEEEADEGSEMFPLIINQINLVEGKFESVDSLHAEPVISLVKDLNLQLESFSTLLGDGSMLNFSLALGSGGELNWQGDFGVNPLFSEGELKLEGLNFAKVWEIFLQERVNFKWVDGTQLLKFKYVFAYENEETVFKLTEGHLLTENLKFIAKEDSAEIIAIPYFSVEGITFDLNEQAIDIAKIESRAADFDAWFSQAGELNYQTVFAGQEQEPQLETDDTKEKQDDVEADVVEEVVDDAVEEVVEAVDDVVIETKPWEINIQDIALNESKIRFSDKRKKEPVLMNITALDIGLKNTHVSAGELLQVTANEGYFTLQDFVVKNQKSQGADASSAQKMMDIPYFSIAGIDFDLSKQAINIATIESRDAGFDAWFNTSGELNYQAAFAGQGSESEATEATVTEEKTGEAAKPWDINIQDIALNKSKFNFTDGRQKEPVLINIAALDIGLQNYHLSAGEQLQMTANQGRLNLQNFALKTAPKSKLVHVPNLQVSGLGFNLQEQSLNIKSVNTRDAVIKAWLAKNGEINYQSLFAAGTNEQAETVPAAEAKGNNESPWKIALEEFKIDNYALEFTDHSPKKPVSLNLSALNFSMAHFNNQQGTKLPLSFSTKVNRKGKIKVSGQTVLEPFSSNLKLAISNVAIAGFQPYINQGANLDIAGGNFNTHGKLALSQAKGSEFKLNYKGGVDIKGLHTRDQILNQDFLKWQLLKLSGLEFNLQPTKLNIKSIQLDKPYARVTIKKDKTTNISDVIVAAESSKKPKKEVKKKSAPVTYKIAKFKITGGESDFSDYSLIIPFVVKLNGLDGAIDNISSNSKATTKVSLQGKTFDFSPVDIQGSFDADLDNLDIAMHYKSLPLPLLSPYMVEFSGNKIEKGKMSLDLMYQVNDGLLSAKNNLLIDQLELGEEVENPDSVDLPLALAIALLKDKDGKIIINMPLTGNMDDPDFSVGPLVFDTFVNLLTKAVASPFTAIGSFLGSDEDFSVVTFEAGSAEIIADQSEKLDALATALTQKPELSLEVRGRAYTNQDWPAMKEQALMDQLKQIRSEELKKEGETKLPEYIQLSEDDYQRLLADLFIKTFPDLGKRSLFGTPKLIYDDMGEFDAVASNMLQGLIKPDPHKLTSLSTDRAKVIARYMHDKGGIDQSRIFILDGEVTPETENNELNADLSLKVQ